MLTLLTAAFVLNAYGIISGRFDYPFPGEIIGLCQLVLGAAISVLTLGGIAAMRAREDKEFSTDGTVLVEPAQIERAKDLVEIVTVTPEPAPWDGDLAILEVKDNDEK